MLPLMVSMSEKLSVENVFIVTTEKAGQDATQYSLALAFAGLQGALRYDVS